LSPSRPLTHLFYKLLIVLVPTRGFEPRTY
jgi:hypothetical protein